MTGARKNLGCEDVSPLLLFYVCEEVSESECAQIDEHLAHCASCSEQLIAERQLCEVLSTPPDPSQQDASGVLLAQCRSELSEALDDLAAPPVQEDWRPFGWVRRWMALRPAWSGAALILFGGVLGAQILLWLQSVNPSSTGGRVVNVSASPKLSDDQLSRMAVAGINFSPSPDSAPGTVQVHLRAEQPMVLSGSAEDSDMRRVLTYVVENGDRFDAGVRLDCLDALKAQSHDMQVRGALVAAARKDQNPAVRMKALEALRDSASDDKVREVLLEALEHDANPGVRVEVVNMLVHAMEHDSMDMPFPEIEDVPLAPPAPALPSVGAAPRVPEVPAVRAVDAVKPELADPGQRVVRALEELQKRDPSRYVRLRSAAALRQIGPRELH